MTITPGYYIAGILVGTWLTVLANYSSDLVQFGVIFTITFLAVTFIHCKLVSWRKKNDD